MCKKLFLFFIMLLSVQLWAQKKSDYDILQKSPANGMELNKVDAADNTMLQNDKYSATLIPGGYFTLGTVNGASASIFDDDCQITFGHPFAKTSYPVFSVDGVWYKPEDYFSASEMSIVKNGDTLKMTALKTGRLSLTFSLYLSGQDQTLKMKSAVKNLDSKSHNIGAALFFDPALGKLGDGRLEYKGSYLNINKIFLPAEMPTTFSLWEKSEGGKGIGIDLLFDRQPAKAIAENWNSAAVSNNPEEIVLPDDIYDLFLKFYWAENLLAQGEEKNVTATVGLKTPDFPKNLFLRWDLPQNFTIDNNVVFPQNISSYVQVNKSGNPVYSALSLKVTPVTEITASQTDFSFGSSIPSYQRITFTPEVLYEPATPDLVIKLMDGSTVIDELHRRIFLPAVPVSDSGLTVKIDSLITTKKPNIQMIFETEVNSSKNKVTTLAKGNIFLFEDLTRITDFSLIKDTTGGVQAADIVFVLDVTGSMSSQIEGVKRNIIEFADSLAKQGIDYQLGLVTFLDAVESIFPFTKDSKVFQQNVAVQYAHGGGDGPENSLQALLDASKYNFRANAKRIAIWITDADYHENDTFTPLVKKQVIDSLLIKGVVVNAIGPTVYKSSYYDPIVLATGGNYYNITGNFRDILLDISRMKSAYKYLLSYVSPSSAQGKKTINLKIRWAGLGGSTFVDYGSGMVASAEKRFSFYPNPFNPEITFKVNKGDYKSAKIRIFNLLGQQVKEFVFDNGDVKSFAWNAKNENGGMLSSGIYFVTLILQSPDQNNYSETAKILYMK